MRFVDIDPRCPACKSDEVTTLEVMPPIHVCRACGNRWRNEPTFKIPAAPTYRVDLSSLTLAPGSPANPIDVTPHPAALE